MFGENPVTGIKKPLRPDGVSSGVLVRDGLELVGVGVGVGVLVGVELGLVGVGVVVVGVIGSECVGRMV